MKCLDYGQLQQRKHTRSLPCHLDDQLIAPDSKRLVLALLHDRLSFVSRAESYEASSLGHALIVEQDVALANVKLKVGKGAGKDVAVRIGVQVAHVDCAGLTRLLAIALLVWVRGRRCCSSFGEIRVVVGAGATATNLRLGWVAID